MKNAHLRDAASLIACAFALSVSTAHAAGVAAGTLIENTATATFSTGSASSSVQSNTVSVRVDELLDVAVASLNGSPVGLAGTGAVLSYSVTNSGNGSEAYHITVDPAVSGNPFNGTIQTIAIDTNGNNTYDPGTDTVVTNGGASAAIPANGSIRVFVLVGLPSGAAEADTSQIRLTATAVTGSGSPGTVFAGNGDGGVDAVVGLSTAESDALASVIAQQVAVSLTKSYVIRDPFGGTSPVPGAEVVYSLVTHTTGSSTAQGVHVTDGIPSGTTYKAGTLKLDGAALTDAADSDTGLAGSGGIDVNLGNLAGGSADRTVSFTVTIN